MQLAQQRVNDDESWTRFRFDDAAFDDFSFPKLNLLAETQSSKRRA